MMANLCRDLFIFLFRKRVIPKRDLEKELFGKKISPLRGICNLHPAKVSF